MHDLRKVVVQFLVDHAGQKGRALQNALHVRIGRGAGKQRGHGGMGLGELRGEVAQMRKLTLVVLLDHVKALPLIPGP